MQPGIDYIGVGTCGVCHDGQGRVFLNLRNKNCRDEWNTWDNCGGQLEFGETPLACIRRELREEYGCGARQITQAGFVNALRRQNGNSTHWLIMTFLILIDPQEAYNAEPQKHQDACWFDINHLPKNRHSYFDRDFITVKPFWDKYYSLRSSTDRTTAS